MHLLSEKSELTNDAGNWWGEHVRQRSSSVETEMGAWLVCLQKSKEASLGRHVCGDKFQGRARAGSFMCLLAMVDVLGIVQSYFGFTSESLI